MFDITHIKHQLAVQAASVAEHLLPAGRKEAAEWRAGSIDGERGQSLGVHLTGAKAGVWTDFSTGEGGDLLDLWAATRRISLSEALAEARDWLGVERPKPYREPEKKYIRPKRPNCTAPKARVRDYLTEERNIPATILEKYKVGEQDDKIVFPFLDPSGELILYKTRPVNDKKGMRRSPNCESILFGWQAVSPNSREIVLTEGEPDALSWAAYGWEAMSVPDGGGRGDKQKWIEADFERMERFERIYLALDMDKEGDEAADEIAGRLGRHRCFRVTMPHKDGNECLMQGVPKAVMDQAILDAKTIDPGGLKRPSDYASAVSRLFWPGPDDHIGYYTPYGRLSGKLNFRPAELSLWSGPSGAGKSQILSDCAVDWVRQGSRVCLSSLEMKPAYTLKRMARQVAGVERPTDKGIRASFQWLDQGLLLYDMVGKASIDTLLEIFDYARGKYGCDQFIIDSLMRLGIAADDYSAQEKAVYRLAEWVVASGVHLHLVAHARKGGSDNGAPEIEDVKGAMEIGANAFNILTVWRNRKHEDEIRKAENAKNDALVAELKEKPGVIFNVAKQRNGDFEGKIGLWFDTATYRYYSSYDRSAWSRVYIEPSSLRGNAEDESERSDGVVVGAVPAQSGDDEGSFMSGQW